MHKLLLALIMFSCTNSTSPTYTVGDRVEMLGGEEICLGTVYAVTKRGTYMVYGMCETTSLEVFEMHELELQLYTGKEGL